MPLSGRLPWRSIMFSVAVGLLWLLPMARELAAAQPLFKGSMLPLALIAAVLAARRNGIATFGVLFLSVLVGVALPPHGQQVTRIADTIRDAEVILVFISALVATGLLVLKETGALNWSQPARFGSALAAMVAAIPAADMAALMTHIWLGGEWV